MSDGVIFCACRRFYGARFRQHCVGVRPAWGVCVQRHPSGPDLRHLIRHKANHGGASARAHEQLCPRGHAGFLTWLSGLCFESSRKKHRRPQQTTRFTQAEWSCTWGRMGQKIMTGMCQPLARLLRNRSCMQDWPRQYATEYRCPPPISGADGMQARRLDVLHRSRWDLLPDRG